MIIWRGLGIFALVAPVGAIAAAQGISGVMFGDVFVEEWTGLVNGGAVAVSGLIVGPLGYVINDKYEEFFDEATGAMVHAKLPTQHSLYFIPMQYWGLILLVGGVALALFGGGG